ncbi:MAG TPA: sodium:calcium antiporter, partial [Anaerolineales bacterium]|nr:sodium:calcium antiporter [Anaerolineales bacterium]
MGTSAPELFVSLEAALTGSDDISVGNVVGSNIANVALVLALTALIFPLPINRDSRRIDWPVMMFVSLLLYAFGRDLRLELYEGLIFVALLIGYVVFSIRWSRKKGRKIPPEEIPPVKFTLPVAILILAVSIVGLYFGSDLLIMGAKNIAEDFGVSQRIIGISLVSFGTSVPELATSVIAAIRKETDISVGNI